ncbi:capsule assembly Wzi family protein [Acidaminococcus timonensis]|uniref:capsule assembly Wzi family protein n=1 Tax=Acidaminococcus timonensis TaxID=1871002 RepID=UPI003C6CC514
MFPSQESCLAGRLEEGYLKIRTGAWDLTLETACTNRDWYRHGTFQQGWTYSGDILEDAMGTDSRTYYARVNHYLQRHPRLCTGPAGPWGPYLVCRSPGGLAAVSGRASVAELAGQLQHPLTQFP